MPGTKVALMLCRCWYAILGAGAVSLVVCIAVLLRLESQSTVISSKGAVQLRAGSKRHGHEHQDGVWESAVRRNPREQVVGTEMKTRTLENPLDDDPLGLALRPQLQLAFAGSTE